MRAMAHSCPDGPGKSDWATYETVFTNSKAGMECVDKDKVKKVVYEMSKVSNMIVGLGVLY